jgi:hypothetical protein
MLFPRNALAPGPQAGFYPEKGMAKVKEGKRMKNHHNPPTRFWGSKNFTPKLREGWRNLISWSFGRRNRRPKGQSVVEKERKAVATLISGKGISRTQSRWS